MSTRKYAFEYKKLKRRKKEEKLIESKKWSIYKFIVNNKQNITQNLNKSITNEQKKIVNLHLKKPKKRKKERFLMKYIII